MLSIQAALTGERMPDIEARYKNKMYGHLKIETSELVAKELLPIQTKAKELLADKAELDRILRAGADQAIAHAELTLHRIHDRIGFILRS